jgi:hypothetical protein
MVVVRKKNVRDLLQIRPKLIHYRPFYGKRYATEPGITSTLRELNFSLDSSCIRNGKKTNDDHERIYILAKKN